MSNSKAFHTTIEAASRFLKPVLNQDATNSPRRSVIESLYPGIQIDVTTASSDNYGVKTSLVIEHALKLLRSCNDAAQPKKSPDALYAPRDQRIILALADLILLEGIYPNVTVGVLPPLDRRTKSSGYFSQVQAASASQYGRNTELLGQIVDIVEPILQTASNEVSDAVRERLQMDTLACLGELAFHPDSGSNIWKDRFFGALERIPSPVLLPLLTPLIQPNTPQWLQQEITSYLSSIPISRPNGVRDIIQFFVNTDADVSSQRLALQQASRLIGAVPTSSTPEKFFAVIVPQLLSLLDGNSHIGTASAIIINDIVEKKRTVEKFFVLPIFHTLRPPKSRIPPSSEIEPGDIVTLTSDEDLEKSLKRLLKLVQASTGYLISRILKFLILPLWGIWQHATKIRATSWIYAQIPEQLLTAYTKLKTGSSALEEIVRNFDYDGEEHWRFGRGEMGGIKLVLRDASDDSKRLPQISDIEDRVPKFINLATAANDDAFTEFFLGLCRQWLNGGSMETAGPDQAFNLLFQLKVLEGILEHHSERLTRRPEQIIVLVKEILDEHVNRLRTEQERRESLRQPTMQSLASILPNETEEVDSEHEPSESITIALQLLNSIISTSFSRAVSDQERKLLTTLQPSLTYLSATPSVPSSLSSLTRSLSLFISTQDNPLPAESSLTQTPQDEKVLKQQQTLQTALLYLRDTMVPVRAHGLELLQQLIAERASVLDIPAITKLCIDMLQDKESFVYLAVVKTLCELTDKHPGTVIGMLVDAYVDERESMGIDERLKIGEALMGTVQRLGEMGVGKVAEGIGNAMIGLAGRRKRRGRELKEVAKAREEDAKRIKEVGEMDKEYANVLKEARKEAGIDGSDVKVEELEDDEQWISKAGEEDYRVRTSALSILGSLYETNASGVPSAVTLNSVDVALSILNLERSKEQATMRRAAVHLISSILNGLESRGTAELLKVIPKEKLEDIVRVFGYVRATDDDGLVRQQAGVLVEALTES